MGIVYVALKQVPVFQHILSHKNLEFLPLDIKKICVYVGPNHPLYHTESIDFENLSSLKFVRGVRDFFSMEHHLSLIHILYWSQRMGAGTMTRNMRLGLAILAAVLICAGCVGEPAEDFYSTTGQLDSALQELGGQDLLNRCV